jgi:CRISPR/Cas system-associated exonuclease Cas4 (RecB family)
LDRLMQLIPIRKKYVYERLKREDREDGRVYIVDTAPLPSVTNVLSDTKDKSHLDAWAARVGEAEADRIKNEAATVGTHMHNVVERLLLNRDLPAPRTWLSVKGYRMGYQLIEHFFPSVQEVWGAEIPLYYPKRYAGTSDCVGVYKNNESIIDFKQTNKMKRREWIEDYFVQLAAYAAAHNEVHGTKIRQGVIMMVAQDGQVQEFTTCGREFDGYVDKWWRRVETFEKAKRALVDQPPELITPEGGEGP